MTEIHIEFEETKMTIGAAALDVHRHCASQIVKRTSESR